jgi:hypothetical protein
MLEMLKGLSLAERKTLADPDFITEDEADIIYCKRAMDEPGRSYSLDEVLAENGIARRAPRSPKRVADPHPARLQASLKASANTKKNRFPTSKPFPS